jgi:ketosteroid isomerase-like protein
MNARLSSSPVAMAVSFMDCINRGDIDGLGALMHDDHELHIFDEPPTVGREANIRAWEGYAAAFPDYLILPSHMAARGTTAAVLGTTAGSHLGLPDEAEMKLTLIWLCEIADGKVLRWNLIADTDADRSRWELG